MAAVRAGERKRLDDIEVDEMDAGLEDAEPGAEGAAPESEDDEGVPSKRRGASGVRLAGENSNCTRRRPYTACLAGAAGARKKQKAPADPRERNRLQSMFAGASGACLRICAASVCAVAATGATQERTGAERGLSVRVACRQGR